ncbi:MAG: DUF86 domain-containing protein [Candidatus Nitrosocaldaceae archaeon]|nr:MAG: DUF86 domain-containing protein [Candidatus Nitrosocaldaceae archaeon]
MSRAYKHFIKDIIDEINNIEEFTKGLSYQDLIKDIKTKYAVIRSLEIIGEAVKNIPDDIKDEHKDIPWKRIAGMRDKLIHAYFGIDDDMLWQTIKEDIPNLKHMIEKLNLY